MNGIEESSSASSKSKRANTGYSNSSSHFSSFPAAGISREKFKFSKNSSYTDTSNTFTVDSPRKAEGAKNPQQELFEKYEREVRIEQRLINKVCEDRELSDLVLNLYKYKQFYRNNVAEAYKKGEESKSYTKKNLYPKHMATIPNERDLVAEIRNVELQRDSYKADLERTCKKLEVMKMLQDQLSQKCQTLETEKQQLLDKLNGNITAVEEQSKSTSYH